MSLFGSTWKVHSLGNSSVMIMIWEEGAERWSGHLGGTQANIQGNWSLAEITGKVIFNFSSKDVSR